MISREAGQETAGWTRENGKSWKGMVGVCRETAVEVAVESECCFQERGRKQGEAKWEILGNREAMALRMGEEGMVQREA